MLSALKQHFKLPEEEGNQLHIVPENPLPKDKQSHKFELGYNEKPSILRRTVITTLFTTFISPFVAKAFIAIGIFAPQAQAYSAFSYPIINILF